MPIWLRFAHQIDRFSLWLGRGVGLLTLLMVLVGAFNAIARYTGKVGGWNLSSNGLLEAQWYMFSLVFLLGAATTLQQDKHVRVDVFYGRLGPKAKAAIDLAGTLLFLLPFCAFVLWMSWPAVRNSFDVREVSPDPGGLPRWPIKGVILVSFVLLMVQGISEGLKRLAVLMNIDRPRPPA